MLGLLSSVCRNETFDKGHWVPTNRNLHPKEMHVNRKGFFSSPLLYHDVWLLIVTPFGDTSEGILKEPFSTSLRTHKVLQADGPFFRVETYHILFVCLIIKKN